MRNAVIFVIILLLFQSCIEIQETITMKADGSGNIQLIADLGKIGKNIQQQSPVFDLSFLEQIKKLPTEADSLLKGCKGISNLKTISQNDKGKYMISFDFKNSKALNTAIYCLARQKKLLVLPDLFAISKHRLSVKNMEPLIKKYVIKDEGNMITDLLYQHINFESVFVFPKPVRKVSNIKAINENDNKTVRLKYTLYELLNSDFDYGMKIRY